MGCGHVPTPTTRDGAVTDALAFNEVSLLRETRQTAKLLAPVGSMLYRTLPNESVTDRAVLRFMLSPIKGDLRRLDGAEGLAD